MEPRSKVRAMSIINSNTTGHSLKQEHKFSNKLFIGLGLAAVAAIVVFVIAGTRSGPEPVPTSKAQSTSDTVPTPLPDTPKNE